METHKRYGYVRVSTKEQHEDRQLIAMQEADVPMENIFVDKQSGKDFKRPMYRKLVKRLRRDDVVYIKSIDRLGRNTRKFWSSGGFSRRSTRSILLCWTCRFWIQGAGRI